MLKKKGEEGISMFVVLILALVVLGGVLFTYYRFGTGAGGLISTLTPEELEPTILKCRGLEATGISVINTYCNDFDKIGDEHINCEYSQVQAALRQIRTETNTAPLNCDGYRTYGSTAEETNSPEKRFCVNTLKGENPNSYGETLVNAISCSTWELPKPSATANPATNNGEQTAQGNSADPVTDGPSTTPA